MLIEVVLYVGNERRPYPVRRAQNIDTAKRAAERLVKSEALDDTAELYIKRDSGGLPLAIARRADGQWDWSGWMT